jgi:gamma-glutamyltranspeptidase/glutathione hydrolase
MPRRTSQKPDRGGGVVSAATPEAAAAGAEILKRGGNAVDAAVATSLALGVTEPAGSGLGGQSTLIVARPGEAPFVINGSSYAPRRLPDDVGSEDLTGHRAATVPTTPRVLDFVWRRFGSGRLSWAELVAPAIGFARDGYVLGPFRHKALRRQARAIRRNATATRLLLADDAAVPGEGATLRSPVLARTLERLGRDGIDDFYRGETAAEIARDMTDHGGWITGMDLKNVPEPPIVPTVQGTYRGWEVHTLPPPGGGWVMLLALNLLERAPAGELTLEGPRRLVWLTEALRHAHRQRLRYAVASPEGVDALEPHLEKRQATRIARAFGMRGSGETTHFSVADREGLTVGVTQSLNSYFGAKVASRRVGVLYNDYMREFVLGRERHPFSLRPGAVPASFMSASVVRRRDGRTLTLGSPGDDRIISAVLQVISHWTDVGDGLAAAVAAPRVHTLRSETVLLEADPGRAEGLVHLEERGYTVYRPVTSLHAGGLNPYFGGVNAVAREGGVWTGAADPRRDGAVARA